MNIVQHYIFITKCIRTKRGLNTVQSRAIFIHLKRIKIYEWENKNDIQLQKE